MKLHLPRRHTPFRSAHGLADLTIAAAALLATAAWTAPTRGQSVLDRPPHLSGGWVALPGVLQFNFLHRFQHTLSVQVANTNTATLQGISLGEDRLRWGFEFTVPVTLRRYLPRPSSPPVAAADTADEDAGPPIERTNADGVVSIAMEGLAYESERVVVPVGTTVVWTNEDPVMHTVTGGDESWDSGDINPGESWERTFEEPGTYPYWCRPHPFMTAVIVVEP